jgi:hypothetical protein
MIFGASIPSGQFGFVSALGGEYFNEGKSNLTTMRLKFLED